ncbi:MAG: NUDIX hydrolase [Balneolia bacterium]|nr:NUDIX hydrolase [Balneolia bacterium]
MNSIDNWRELSDGLKETQLSTEQIFKGDLLDVRRDAVQLPDSSQTGREYIVHPGASAVLPVYDNGDIMLVGQYRYPVALAMLEVPAGKLDAGESPETTAKRELTEETGLRCRHIHRVGHFHPCIGYSDEVIYLFVGWDIEQEAVNTDDDEFLTHHRLPFSRAIELIHDGTITDGKTIVTLLRVWKWWQAKGPFRI